MAVQRRQLFETLSEHKPATVKERLAFELFIDDDRRLRMPTDLHFACDNRGFDAVLKQLWDDTSAILGFLFVVIALLGLSILMDSMVSGWFVFLRVEMPRSYILVHLLGPLLFGLGEFWCCPVGERQPRPRHRFLSALRHKIGDKPPAVDVIEVKSDKHSPPAKSSTHQPAKKNIFTVLKFPIPHNRLVVTSRCPEGDDCAWMALLGLVPVSVNRAG